MKCDCGGKLESRAIKSYDFTAFAGIPCELRDVPGYRCDRCGDEQLQGIAINASLAVLAINVTRVPGRLNKELARFLRKRMGLTQEELANRMGIIRETVGKWECGLATISPAHDYILRSLVLSHLAARAIAGRVPASITEQNHVRTEPPPADLPPFVIDAKNLELRERGRHARRGETTH